MKSAIFTAAFAALATVSASAQADETATRLDPVYSVSSRTECADVQVAGGWLGRRGT